MATANPFDLLKGDDIDDPSQLIIAAQQMKVSAPAPTKKAVVPTQAANPKLASLPSKPLPPSQAVKEARNETGRGGGRGGGGRGRGRGGFNRDSNNIDNSFNGFSGGNKPTEEKEAGRSFERRGGYGGPRGSFRGGRQGGFHDGEEGERSRRAYDRRSGTGRGNEVKREGAGRGNWGTPADEITPEIEEPLNEEKNIDVEKPLGEEDPKPTDEPEERAIEEKEPEEKQLTLEEYEKVLEEKRKALLALKAEERKVAIDKDLVSMKQLSSKKDNNEIFAKLGSDKDKRKEAADKEEKAKKSVSISEFLKPAEGERQGYGGRGPRRDRGGRGGGYGGRGNNQTRPLAAAPPAPAINDDHFPSLGGK